ncbi:hypothetical protein [Roseococcus sp. YIM B11640]|uniref:hypothetical protein n=1 Tax=Roseococcus sp. YIM B11640 TaxID=3133973 RepID=UPI003C79B525
MGGWKDQKRAFKREWRERKSRIRDEMRGGSFSRPVPQEGPRRVFGWRVWMLPLFLWPLVLDIPIEIVLGHPRHLLGACLGLGLAWLAAARMARGTEGDVRRGAILMGAAAGLTAGLAAGLPAPIAVALGFGAWFGTRLLTDDLGEIAPEPVPEPEQPARPDPLDGPRAQLAHIASSAPGLPHTALLLEAAGAMQGVVEDLELRPARLHEARRFLAVHLDGLTRIVDRLGAGAEPPESLPGLLTDLTASARKLRAELRNAESEALDIQVKVLAERLRQEEP